MAKGDTATQNTSQTTNTAPWQPTMPLLNNLLGTLQNTGMGVTSNQNDAMSQLLSAVQGLPNFGPQAAGGIDKFFNTDVSGQTGMLSDAYKNMVGNMSPVASASLDPYSTPGFSDAIKTMTGDITKNVKDVYNSSGRDPSGAGSFAGSLGRGLTQGIAPTISSQYNANVGNRLSANNALMSGAGSTASGIAGLNQIPLQNILQGIGGAGSIPGLLMGPSSNYLNVANQAYNQPYGNMSQWQSMLLPIAGLGQSSQGYGTGSTFQPQNLMSNIISGGLGASALMFSDERLKEDKEPVGMLFDGQPVWSFRYIGDETPRIGLMAQEVEERHPEAVADIGGVKAVDYGIATKEARQIGGMLSDMRMAA